MSSVRDNLFPDALSHVDRCVGKHLEDRSKVLWSSQALCISVFGTLAECDRRDDLINAILATAGLEVEPKGQPDVCCEVRGRRRLLNEIGGSNPTCPDVLAEWPALVLTVESKFTEHLGTCGQISLHRKRDGSVELVQERAQGNTRLDPI
jgi:hypothetical protein